MNIFEPDFSSSNCPIFHVVEIKSGATKNAKKNDEVCVLSIFNNALSSNQKPRSSPFVSRNNDQQLCFYRCHESEHVTFNRIRRGKRLMQCRLWCVMNSRQRVALPTSVRLYLHLLTPFITNTLINSPYNGFFAFCLRHRTYPDPDTAQINDCSRANKNRRHQRNIIEAGISESYIYRDDSSRYFSHFFQKQTFYRVLSPIRSQH